MDEFSAAELRTMRQVVRETTVKNCECCNKTDKHEGTSLSTCSRCRVVRYCSPECQKKDWAEHKLACKADPAGRTEGSKKTNPSQDTLQICMVEANRYHAEGNHEGEVRAYLTISDSFRSIGQFHKATDFGWKSMEIAQRLEVTALRATLISRSYSALGEAVHGRGMFDTALGYHQKSLSYAEEAGAKAEQGSAYSRLGKLCLSLNEPQKAEDYHKKAILIARELGDKRLEAEALSNLGAMGCHGNKDEALKWQKEALLMLRALGDKHAIGHACGNLSLLYEEKGEFPEAMKYVNESLRIAKEEGDRCGEGVAYGRLGSLFRATNKLKKACEFHKKWYTVAEEMWDRRSMGEASTSLGEALCESAWLSCAGTPVLRGGTLGGAGVQ
jgi:tetratricopeptide (TPR) repeat protein